MATGYGFIEERRVWVGSEMDFMFRLGHVPRGAAKGSSCFHIWRGSAAALSKSGTSS